MLIFFSLINDLIVRMSQFVLVIAKLNGVRRRYINITQLKAWSKNLQLFPVVWVTEGSNFTHTNEHTCVAQF